MGSPATSLHSWRKPQLLGAEQGNPGSTSGYGPDSKEVPVTPTSDLSIQLCLKE